MTRGSFGLEHCKAVEETGSGFITTMTAAGFVLLSILGTYLSGCVRAVRRLHLMPARRGDIHDFGGFIVESS